MKRLTTVKCPECGHPNKYRLDISEEQQGMIYCDIEDGGCDRKFWYELKITVEAETFKIVKP